MLRISRIIYFGCKHVYIFEVYIVNKMDCRFIWLSESISNLLGIFDRKYADTLVNEHSEEFKSFFNDDIIDFSENNKQLLFIWRTFYDKLVEKTITVLEEGK